jgi:predicted RNase H-like HicB family nuclease
MKAISSRSKNLTGRCTVTRDFSVIIERDTEGYYVATVPGLRGCHTQARSLDELIGRVKEAIQVCLEAEGDDAVPLDFIGVQRITLAS